MTPREVLAEFSERKQKSAERDAERREAREKWKLREWAMRIPYSMPDDPDYVDAKRKAALQHRDEMLAFQKAAAKAGDRDAARFFKEEASDAMRQYRGACLVLGHLLCDPPGDSPFRRTDEWPLEIVPYAGTL